MPLPDLLRLLAIPVLAWAAWQDVETRRVPGWIWYPLLALGIVLIGWDWLILPDDRVLHMLYIIRVTGSILLMSLLGLAFWKFGGIGLADAKAFVTIGVVYPIFPTYQIAGLGLPAIRAAHGIFSLTILVDGAIVGLLVPVGLYVWNAAHGRYSPKGLFYLPASVHQLMNSIGSIYVGDPPTGSLFQKVEYYVSMLNPQKDRLDLDALRMYLRWRGIAIEDVRSYPDQLRRPNTLPAEPNPPTDGVVDPELDPEPVNGIPAASFVGADKDPWGAEIFLEDVQGAYGTTPEQLRTGLDTISTEDFVWITPGLPMLVSIFIGLLIAIILGDIYYGVLTLAGII